MKGGGKFREPCVARCSVTRICGCRWLSLALAALIAVPAAAEIRVVDDTGAAVALAAPARRIVTLAPHATELVFAAGGGA